MKIMTGIRLTLFVLQLLSLQLGFFIKSSSCQEVTFNLNTKKIVATTSDKFLSLTIDPAVLLTGDVLTSSTELSTNMAKAFSPGYVRLAGPKSNFYTFERSLFPQNEFQDPDLSFSEAHWVLVQQWAQRAGLDIVASLSPQRTENDDQTSTWDPKNSLELISFSDHMGYNLSWQLGYECQTRVDVSGFDLGKDVARLKSILAAFPRYANSIIVGPDIVSFRGKMQQQFIQDYLNAAGNSLSVITWHPDFAGIALDSDGVSLQTDTLAVDKELLHKAMGRSAIKKPLWIAESKPEECKQQFLGALVWARRLGNAAKLGVQVIMRQPDALSMFQPTPDYWVSLLHKMLVGKEVLDAKLTSGNKTNVHFYCQCTKQSAKYDRGAVTIFGINLTPAKVSVSLKGLKIKTIHKYILMPGYDTENRMFAETVLLNDEPLALVNGKNLPEINPAVTLMGKNMAVKLPSGGIGFWVIPGARVKTCLGHDDEIGDKSLLLKKLTKKLEDQEIVEENVGQEFESDNHADHNEAESAEDLKSLLKSKKKKVVAKYRHNDDADDEDRRFKRIDTKKEFEKLEKLLKRNNNGNKEDKNIGEKEGTDDEKEEEIGVMRLKGNERAQDSVEEIRNKLEEYKNKLSQYESRRKINNDYQKSEKVLKKLSSDDVDAQKAMEALALISKFDGAVKSGEMMKYEDKKSADFHDIGEEMLIQELEKSEKIKRMIDPKSLGKIYEYFVINNRDKLHNRNRRDLDKLFGEDPLGLRKDGLFKKRAKIEDVKERRLERKNRKRDREDIGLKKELPTIVKYDPRNADSSENNFYGFPQMKPLENFPTGDVFLAEGTSSEERSHDYDYVKDDDDDDERTMRKRNHKNRRGKPKRQNKPIQDETWIEDPNSNVNQMPNEFFERFNLPPINIKTQWKDYTELYEPESSQAKDLTEDVKHQENNTLAIADSLIIKDRLDERDDKRAKETAVKKLMNYYDNTEIVGIEPTLEYNKKEIQVPKLKINGKLKTAEAAPQSPKKLAIKPNRKPEDVEKEENLKKLFDINSHYGDRNEDVGSMEFVNSETVDDYSDELYSDDEIAIKKRPKRKTKNLNHDAFGQEMINEDVNNLKDCKCRVIRSTGKIYCKNSCAIQRTRRNVEQDVISEEENTEDEISDTTTEILEEEKNTESDVAEVEKIDLEGTEKPKSDLQLEFQSTSSEPEILPEEEKAIEIINDDVHSKRDVTVVSAENPEGLASTKSTLGTGESAGLSSGSELVGSKLHKNNFDLKFKSEDKTKSIKTDSVKTKLALKSESLKDVKRAEVAKAIESSSKLKSVDNTKYVEYQRKQAEKLSILKEKLRERKAKILQQYRQELLEALNKCDTEVEKNLKRREIWNNFNNQEEFREFFDKDKLAYLMINRPVNYEDIEDQDGRHSQEEDRRYYPEIEIVQPVRNERQRKFSHEDNRDHFYWPKTINQQSSMSDVEEHGERREQKFDDDNESYYALVESLENPKIFSKKQFDEDSKHEEHKNHQIFEAPVPVVKKSINDNEDNNFLKSDSWDSLIPEYHDGIMHHKKYSSGIRKNRDLQPEEYYTGDVIEIPLKDGVKILKKIGPLVPCSDGKCGEKKSFVDAKELEESLGYYEGELSSEEEDIGSVMAADLSGIRKGREIRMKRSGYVCLKEDSNEDAGETENRIFKLVKNDDYYEAVPIFNPQEESVATKDARIIRRRFDNDKIRSKRRKYSSDLSMENAGSYHRNYYKNGKYMSKNLGNDHDEIDYRNVGDEINRVEADKYEVLMLIPVKKHELKRHRRDLTNDIERAESTEHVNNVWGDVVDAKESEKRLKEYVDAKQKTYNDFQEAQTNLNWYLKKLKSMQDPEQVEEFDRFVLNLGSPGQDKMTVIGKTDEEAPRIILGEYLKKEILDTVHDEGNEPTESESSSAVETTTTTKETTLFDATMPKLKSTINNELEKVGNLTESLENFINDFDAKFNDTLEFKNREKSADDDKRKGRISHNIFQNALKSVKKFFDFLTGVSLIFRRH